MLDAGHDHAGQSRGFIGEQIAILDVSGPLQRRSLYPQKRPFAALPRNDAMGHVWTAPAVQEESDVLRSVRVQPCIRPVFAWRLASIAMRPLWPLALM